MRAKLSRVIEKTSCRGEEVMQYLFLALRITVLTKGQKLSLDFWVVVFHSYFSFSVCFLASHLTFFFCRSSAYMMNITMLSIFFFFFF